MATYKLKRTQDGLFTIGIKLSVASQLVVDWDRKPPALKLQTANWNAAIVQTALFDTGASICCVDRAALDLSGIRPISSSYNTVVTRTELCNFYELEILIEGTGKTMTLLFSQMEFSKNLPFSVILGSNFISEFDSHFMGGAAYFEDRAKTS